MFTNYNFPGNDNTLTHGKLSTAFTKHQLPIRRKKRESKTLVVDKEQTVQQESLTDFTAFTRSGSFSTHPASPLEPVFS